MILKAILVSKSRPRRYNPKNRVHNHPCMGDQSWRDFDDGCGSENRSKIAFSITREASTLTSPNDDMESLDVGAACGGGEQLHLSPLRPMGSIGW